MRGLGKILNNLAKVSAEAKVPLVIFIFLVAIGIVGYNVFVGGQDKRALITTVLALIAFSLLVFFTTDIVNALNNLAR